MSDTNKPGLSGFDADSLKNLTKAIEGDIAEGKYFGANILIARGGEIALHEQIGHSCAEKTTPITEDSVFTLFSLTKAFTNILTFAAIDRGDFALTTRVSDIIPEFSGGLRERINVKHLLTHSSGLPSVFTPRPGMYLDVFDDMIEAVCQNIHSVKEPGVEITYSPMVHHALMGEMIRRCDSKKRSLREIYEEDLFAPLGMTSTSMGVRKDLKDRHHPPEFNGNAPTNHIGSSDLGPHGAFEEEFAEMPWVGCISDSMGIFRFAEMLRRHGELDGNRIVSPAILAKATQNWTGEVPNELYKQLFLMKDKDPAPGYIGLGFSMRGKEICHHQMGTLNSENAYGNYGAGTTLFWVDPDRDITFVCMTTGVVEESDNVLRFQRLSDLALSAAI